MPKYRKNEHLEKDSKLQLSCIKQYLCSLNYNAFIVSNNIPALNSQVKSSILVDFVAICLLQFECY